MLLLVRLYISHLRDKIPNLEFCSSTCDTERRTKHDYRVFLEENFRYVVAIDESTLTLRAYNIFGEISSREITLAEPPRHNFWWSEIVLTYFVIALVWRSGRIYMHEAENACIRIHQTFLLKAFMNEI